MYIFVKIKALTDFTIPSVCLHRLYIPLDPEIISAGISAGFWHYKCALKLELKCLVLNFLTYGWNALQNLCTNFWPDLQCERVEILGSRS